MAETVAPADSVVAEEDESTQEVPPQMKPFLVEEDNNTGTDQMKVMEFPFPEDDTLNDIDGDRHQIQQKLKQKKSQQQMQQNHHSLSRSRLTWSFGNLKINFN